MNIFFKSFFATLLALIMFCFIAVVVLVWMVSRSVSIAENDNTGMGDDIVLFLDLSNKFEEQPKEAPLDLVRGKEGLPGLYDMVQMIHHAASDSAVKGIYLKAGENNNGFAAGEELRSALNEFKQNGKFIIAYGEIIDQKAYYVASVADKVYCHPKGGVEWSGYSSNIFFLKGLLDKLEIEPQIFYAGKFKSATEPLRVTQMTDPNRLQTMELLQDLYNKLLLQTASARNIDTAILKKIAHEGLVQTAAAAVSYRLVDGEKYDDEIKTELLQRLKLQATDKINFVSFGKYAQSVNYEAAGSEKIALIYAQGDIISGKGREGENIGSDLYKNLIRNARLDKNIKAIVFRVNSPGGSALASDVIWREISLAQKEKPVVVSMGDYAASGGYYISCAADSIFADQGTITGSIGVFSVIPNMQSFFKNKLGVTFDGVKTGQYADMGNVTRPLTAAEKRFVQAGVDSIYYTFKSRVAEGRKRSMDYVDSIAQGRVWTGDRALSIGLIDKIGTLRNAIDCAAGMAKINSYKLHVYPEKQSLLELIEGILDNTNGASLKENAIKNEIGAPQYEMFMKLKRVQAIFGIPQAKLPFEIEIN